MTLDVSGNSGKSKIQRYSLRSAIKPKEEKEKEKPSASSEFSNSTASKRFLVFFRLNFLSFCFMLSEFVNNVVSL